MILHNDICSINISIDTTYTVESTDNKPYDLVINPRHLKHSDMYKVFSIQIDLFSKTISIAMIGDFYSYDKDCAVLEDKILTILQNDAIIQLNINDGTMIKFKEFDCFGCNYGIYRVQNGYIVYGEIEITMLDFNFNKKCLYLCQIKRHLSYVRTQLSYMILKEIFMKLIFQES